jgi:predicted HAD superfamily Cof-like phosphohydrolase
LRQLLCKIQNIENKKDRKFRSFLFISCIQKILVMQDPKSLTSVALFHQTFKHPIVSNPAIPSETRCNLRVSLLAEELKELEDAIENKDLVEIADALCDLQYVLSGAILEFGLGEKFKTLFDEVQRSNMSKACITEEGAKATVAHYEAKGTPSFYEKEGDLFLVFREGDHKTLKSVNYSPADLKGILDK